LEEVRALCYTATILRAARCRDLRIPRAALPAATSLVHLPFRGEVARSLDRTRKWDCAPSPNMSRAAAVASDAFNALTSELGWK